VKVEVVATKASLTFFDEALIKQHGVNVWKDEDEWKVCEVQCEQLLLRIND